MPSTSDSSRDPHESGGRGAAGAPGEPPLQRSALPEGAPISDLEVLATARDWLADGRGVALATVIETWGSSPRPAGSQCAVSDRMELVGSVSGGCVEGAVIQGAQEVIATGEPTTVEFQVVDDEAWSVGLACGGRVRIRISPVERGGGSERLLGELTSALEGGATAAVATPLDGGAASLILVDDAGAAVGDAVSPGAVEARLLEEVLEAVRADRSRTVEGPAGPVFVRVYNRRPRLVIVGAVHIAQPLASMARLADLDTVVVDPRPVFASAERFPGVRLERAWPDSALPALRLDHRTAVVSLSHDPKLDDPALDLALRSPAFYIGALGSRRTHEKRIARLREAGFTEEDTNRIAAPIGLDIGARTPSEIAVAIVAQVVAALRMEAPAGATR